MGLTTAVCKSLLGVHLQTTRPYIYPAPNDASFFLIRKGLDAHQENSGAEVKFEIQAHGQGESQKDILGFCQFILNDHNGFEFFTTLLTKLPRLRSFIMDADAK